jgi:DnaJ-class molecular chaperone
MAVRSRDYYEVLGVSRKATPVEIKAAHRKLARKHHPDLNQGNKQAEERFKEIQRAYDVLSDPEKRKKYDMFGENWEKAGEAPPGWEGFRAPKGPGPGPGGGAEGGGFAYDFGDLGDLGGEFGDLRNLFGGLGGGRGRARRTAAMRGQDIEAELELSLVEAHNGGRRSFQVRVSDICPACGGTSRVAGKLCPGCRGTGVQERSRAIDVNLPAGAREGTTMRLRGQGGAGTGGGGAGDLFLTVRLLSDPVFTLRGDDLESAARIAPWEAVLGARIEVPTLEGPVTLTVPGGSQTDQKLRLRGRGLNRRGGGRGDQFVRLAIVVPESLSAEERRLFEELRQISAFKPRP